MEYLKPIDPRDLTILSQGTLPTTGAPYILAMLAPMHSRHIKALHDLVIDALPPDEKGFVLRKSHDYFAAHFGRGHGNAFIGVISQGKLIAQAMILHPTTDKPDTGMVDMQPVGVSESVTVLQAVSVLPACRGSGLMNQMVAHWLDHAAAHGRIHALAEIEVRNKASWSAFLTAGLSLKSIGRDPSDGTLVYNAHETVAQARQKKLTPVFNDAALVACPLDDLTRQQALMQDGYVATGWDRAQKVLLLQKPSPL